jgi:DNA end-binding protein Ku
VVLRFRQHVAALLPEGRLLVLEMLRYHHELRDSADLEVPDDDLASVGVGARELEMAQKLVEYMDEPWHPEVFRDEYRDDVMKLIEEKARGGGVEIAHRAPAEEAVEGAEVIDIMALLKRSVERAGGEASGGEASGGDASGGDAAETAGKQAAATGGAKRAAAGGKQAGGGRPAAAGGGGRPAVASKRKGA